MNKRSMLKFLYYSHSRKIKADETLSFLIRTPLNFIGQTFKYSLKNQTHRFFIYLSKNIFLEYESSGINYQLGRFMSQLYLIEYFCTNRYSLFADAIVSKLKTKFIRHNEQIVLDIGYSFHTQGKTCIGCYFKTLKEKFVISERVLIIYNIKLLYKISARRKQ